MTFGNLKIGKKLLVGFGLTLAVMLSSFATSLYYLNAIDRESMAVSEHYLPYAFQADAMEKDLLKIQQDFFALANEHVPNPKRQQGLQDKQESFRQSLAMFQRMFAEMGNKEYQGKADDIDAAFKQFLLLGENMIQAFHSQGMEAGHGLSKDFDAKALELENNVEMLRQRQAEVVNAASKEVVRDISMIRLIMLVTGGGAILCGIIMALLLNANIARPITSIAAAARRIADGEMSLRIEVESRDEVGELGTAFNFLVDKVETMLTLNRTVLNSIPDPVFMVDDNRRIILANQATADFAGLPLEALSGRSCADIFQSAACGDTCPAKRKEVRAVLAADLMVCQKAAQAVFFQPYADTVHDQNGQKMGVIEVLRDVTGLIRKEEVITKSFERVSKVHSDVSEAANQIANVSNEIAVQVAEVSNGAEVQKGRVKETVLSMGQLRETILEVARNATLVAEQASQAKSQAQEGSEIVRRSVEAISVVHRLAGVLKEDTSSLGSQASAIGQIIEVISDIADQTNLLALNAAIEAARAGEAGRGFAVVADEVRKLAEKTMKATTEVGAAIQSIQGGVDKNIHSMDQAVQAIDSATEMANRSGAALNKIVPLVDATSDQVRSIATAAEEQSATCEEIFRNVDNVNEITVKTAEGMDQSAKAIADLADLARRLGRLAEQDERV